jgi:6-pyruvoyltetrahydropterin/6-carboxytetrahydropterin synthase
MEIEEYMLEHRFKFDSGHYLTGLAPDHPCTEKHGHTWHCRIVFISNVCDANGMVMDFHDIKHIVKMLIVDRLDHHTLNDVLDFNPTCENLARWMFHTIAQYLLKTVEAGIVFRVACVCVNETEDNACIYTYRVEKDE